MKNNRIADIKVIFVLMAVVFTACHRPVVVVEDIPSNTPPGSMIFITGEFNRWDPGDQQFMLKMDSDSNYLIDLPNGFGMLNFKLTRGDWTTVETDPCGYEIPNRQLIYGDDDTVYIQIESWQDLEAINCPEVTIVIDNLPEGTPEGEPIAIAGDFNEWTPDSTSYMTLDTASGKYVFTMPRLNDGRSAEYIITRGDLRKAEANKYGKMLEKREIRFGLKDTIYIDVENWEDMAPVRPDKLIVILGNIPEEHQGDKYFITGNFNGWYPRDYNYRFNKNDEGKYEVVIPRIIDELQFKITRGDWSTEEVDVFGYKKNNYEFSFGTADTIFLEILGWLDRTEVKQPEYTFIIDQLPKGTPENARIYMASSVNGWNPNSAKFRFKKNNEGTYYLTLKDAWRFLEYKLTLGRWKKQELDKYGQPIPNRRFEYEGQDTIRLNIVNWMGIPAFNQDRIVIVIDSLPFYTPFDQDIYIAGSFNDWNPGDPEYILDRNSNGLYFISIPRRTDEIQFKFTLGSWDYEEQNAFNHNIGNRVYQYGYVDTLRLKVENWKGL